MPKASNPTEANQVEKKQRGPDTVVRAKTRTMTSVQFEGVRPFLRISTDRIEAARLAMVEQQRFTDIAKQFGWESRQSVDRVVAVVWEVFQRYLESQDAVSKATANMSKQYDSKQHALDAGVRAKSRTMTSVQFEGVRPFLKIPADRIEAARLAMVEQQNFTDIATMFGWKSRKSVDRVVSLVWEAFQRYKESQEAVAKATARKRGQ